MNRDTAYVRAKGIRRDALFCGSYTESIQTRHVRGAKYGEYQILEISPPIDGIGRLREIVASADSWEEALAAYERRRRAIDFSLLHEEALEVLEVLEAHRPESSLASRFRALVHRFEMLEAAR
jgi:hypothetical protein